MRQPSLPEDGVCSKKVTSCGDKSKPTGDADGCHVYYKCIDGAAYSCQNPKIFRSTCSERYWNKGGTEKYTCGPETTGGQDCKQ